MVGLDLMALSTIYITLRLQSYSSSYMSVFVSDIAIFVLKRDVKLQLTN